MKAPTRWVRLVAAGAAVAGFLTVSSGCRFLPQRADRVNADTIRSIEIGMSEEEVIAILGPPLRARPCGQNCALLDYAMPGWSGRSPSLWVAFDHGVVDTVHAKIHPLVADDHAIYEAAAHHSIFETADFETAFGRP